MMTTVALIAASVGATLCGVMSARDKDNRKLWIWLAVILVVANIYIQAGS
jgi:hypothetical protein